MLQEYLIQDNNLVAEIKKYITKKNEGLKNNLSIQLETTSLFESGTQKVSFWTKSNSADAAKILSDIDTWIKKQTMAGWIMQKME